MGRIWPIPTFSVKCCTVTQRESENYRRLRREFTNLPALPDGFEQDEVSKGNSAFGHFRLHADAIGDMAANDEAWENI
jgi:hypothetical protein